MFVTRAMPTAALFGSRSVCINCRIGEGGCYQLRVKAFYECLFQNGPISLIGGLFGGGLEEGCGLGFTLVRMSHLVLAGAGVWRTGFELDALLKAFVISGGRMIKSAF